MRWLLIFLVILNALVFAWFNFEKQYQQAQEQAKTIEFDFSKVASLQLLQELPEQELHQRDRQYIAQQQADVQPLPVATVDEPGCLIAGSFPEIVSARQARIDLNDEGIASRVVQINEQLPAVSWVYIPPLANKAQALALLKQLQSKKVDSFLVSEQGPYENAISLGFYGNEQSAQQVLKERQAQGYAAQLTQRVRERPAFWLAIEDQALLNSADFASKLDFALNRQKDVKKKEISCDKLALLESIK